MSPSEEILLSHSQNFFRDPRLIDTLLDSSTIHEHDLVYEVGPGTGTITERLARRCRQVIAVEKDPRLVGDLRSRFHAYPNISIHSGDFLHFPLPDAPFKVFANIPYAITAAIVTRLTSARTTPLDSYVIVQREAAERVSGVPRGTLFAVLLYPWFGAEIVHHFRRGDFRPVPKVESVLLRLHRRDQPLVQLSDAQYYRDFIAFAYTSSRPALQFTLRACLNRRLADHIIRSERLDPAAAPSTVPGTLWLLLFEHLKDAGGVRAMHQVAGAEQRLRRQQAGLQKLHRTRVRAASSQ
jgi:23S rRNA (adenine-N6)-dimethyltransferase